MLLLKVNRPFTIKSPPELLYVPPSIVNVDVFTPAVQLETVKSEPDNEFNVPPVEIATDLATFPVAFKSTAWNTTTESEQTGTEPLLHVAGSSQAPA